MEFHKKFKLELRDYISFNLFTSRKLLIIAIILALTLPFPFLYIMGRFKMPSFNDFIITLVMTVAVMALLTMLVILLIRRNLKKQYYSTKLMQAENEYVINEGGLVISGEYGTTNMKWPDIFKITESKTAIYIYITKAQAVIIPIRCLDPEEEKTLRTILRKNFPGNQNRLIKQ